jgi:prepilin peptidase CpaA
MIFLILYMFGAVSAVGMGFLAAQSDYRGMTIPNRYALLIIGCFFAAWLAAYAGGVPVFAPLASHLLAAGLTFAVTFALFVFKIIGGGDSKLATAFALWVSARTLPVFLFYMSFFGFLLGLAALYLKKRKPVKTPKPGSWIARVQAGESAVPYGIPIFIGGALSFFILGYFSPEKLALFLSVPE